MNANKYWKISAVIVLAVLISGAALMLKPLKLNLGQKNAEFIIASGQSLSATARELSERGLIYSRSLFIVYAILAGHEKDFKAGRYLLPKTASTYQLVRIFSNGGEANDIEITIPEGANIADTDRIFSKNNLINEGDLIRRSFGGGNIAHEGELFPDTYRFKLPDGGKLAATDIIEKMRSNFSRKTRGLFAYFSGQNAAQKTYDATIVASILEKEVKTEQDMRLVAGIMEKRLKLGMPLEIDAAVAYGVCYPKFLAGRYCDVSQADIVDNIKVDSEYNTYIRKGLPAGPISNPGLKAIQAALNPQPSDYLYYLTTKDGATIFSRTAAEHLRAKQKYL